MLFQESLASLSIWSLSFALPARFCVPECHRNRVESSTAEKVLFFQFSRSPLRENQRHGGEEFTVAEGIRDLKHQDGRWRRGRHIRVKAEARPASRFTRLSMLSNTATAT